MSNLRSTACLLAFSLFLFSAPGKAAQAGVYAANDLLLFFQNPAGTTGTDKVVYFNLGSTFNVFRDAATPGSAAFGSTIPLGNINTILTSTYGADWTSLSSSIFFAANGQNGSTAPTSRTTQNGDYARTVYITKARTSAGSVGQANSPSPLYAPSITAVAGNIAGANNIEGMTQPGAVLADGTATTGNTLLDDYNPFFNGNPATAYSAINGGLMGSVTNASYTFGSVARVVSALDLYRVAQTSGTGTTSASIWHNANNIVATYSNDFGMAGGGSAAAYYLGTITLSSDGSVNFVARQAEPEIALTGDDLTGMTTTQGAASTHRNLTITAAKLGTNNLTIALPDGFEVSTNGGATYATTGTIAPSNGAVTATVRVRIAATATLGNLGGDVSVSAAGKTVSKPVSGTVGPPGPTLNITATLSSFVTTSGTPSAAQTFSVSGSNLTSALNVTAPPGYELRRAGSGAYASSASISHVSGTVAAAPIEIRIAASAAAGLLNGNVNVSSSGATPATLSVSGTVNAAPLLTVSPSSISGLSATQGTVSAAKTFTVSGANLTGNVTVAAPDGFEVSNGGGSYSGSLTLARTGGTLANTTISVRITAAANVGSLSGNITVSSSGASNKSVAVSGTVVPPPSITLSGTLAAFTATQGTASTAQTFTVSGANLTGNVTVTAPTNFEVSTDGTNYGNSRTLTPSSGSVASTTISVRIAASAPNGAVGGNVRINSAGAAERTLAASGVVGSQPAVSVVSNLSTFSTTQGTASVAQAFTVSGANLTGNVTVTAPANFEVSTDGASFADSLSLMVSVGSLDARTVSVRIKATAPVGAVSGNITVSSTGVTSQAVAVSGTVVPPPSITLTGILAAFSTTAGTASAAQTFTVSGANLTGDVTVTAPSGFELSSGGGSYAGGLTLTPSAGTLASTTISVRLSAAATVGSPSGSITLSSSGASSKTVAVSGTVSPSPSITVSGTLAAFTAIQGAASTAQTFTVSGSNLTGNVTVTAPDNFEVSTDGTSFITSLTLTPSGGSVASMTISVRVAASASPGPVAGNVNVAAAGAVGRTVAVTGTVAVRPRIDVTGSLTSFSTSANIASSEQTLVIGGSNLSGDITVTAPARYEVSVGGGASFATSVTLTPASGSVNRNIFVRLAAAPAGSYTGDLTFSSPEAAARAVLLSGVVTPPPTITTTGSFGSFATTVGAPSRRQSFSASGANLTADLLITAPSGYEISTDGRSYGPSLTVVRRAGSASARVFVRIAAATPVGSPSGVITLSSEGASERTLPVSGSVVPRPSISVAGDLRPFATVVGRASSSLFLTLVGSDLVGPVIVTAPRGYEVAGQRKAFARSLSLSSSRGVLNERIMIRLSRSTKAAHPRGEVKVTSTGASPLVMAVQGQVSSVPAVSLTGSPKAFAAARGRASGTQVVRVSGKDLKSVVSVTAPSGFQVSANGKNFSSRVQFNPKGGAVTNQRVWIRVASNSRARELQGSLTASSSGAETRIIRVSGRIR